MEEDDKKIAITDQINENQEIKSIHIVFLFIICFEIGERFKCSALVTISSKFKRCPTWVYIQHFS